MTMKKFLTTSTALLSSAAVIFAAACAEQPSDEIPRNDIYQITAEWDAVDNISVQHTTYTVDDAGNVNYNVVTNEYPPVGLFTFNITVGPQKTIVSFEIVGDGSTGQSYSDLIYKGFVGKSQSFFASVIGEDGQISDNTNYEDNGISTGATYSNYICLSAALFATANYDRAKNFGDAPEDEDTSGYFTRQITYGNFGTTSSLRVSADFPEGDGENDATRRLEELNSAVTEFLNNLENSISTDISGSFISIFNSAPADSEVEIDELTYTVLSEALYMYEYTGGYYNPTVYYSVDLFGFSPRFNTYTFQAELSTRKAYDRLSSDGRYVTALSEPDEHYVEIFADLASHADEIEVYERDGHYYAYKPAYTVEGLYGDEYTMALDLGGIGKGYAADVVNGLMDEYGFKYGFFTLGSSSYYVKRSATTTEGTWEMNQTNPDNPFGAYARVYISDVALSTSGDYEKAYRSEQTNQTYCHIIDPFTGRPKTVGIAACTVIGGTAARDDALTTALLVMGEQKAVEFINANLKSYMVSMIVRGSDGSCEHIVTNIRGLEYNPAYTLANTIDGAGNIVLN